jgi:hypothetical protein
MAPWMINESGNAAEPGERRKDHGGFETLSHMDNLVLRSGFS